MEEETLQEVITKYLKKGFGTMTKNDFEVWIFHYLMQHELQSKTNYDISIELRIPETKVKRLRYEADLKYPSVNEDGRRLLLIDAIHHAKFRETKEGQVIFAINDKMLRSYLENRLIKDGRYYDSSFMSNIIVLSVNDFLFVLEELLLTKEDKKQIINQVKSNLKDSQVLPSTLPEILQDSAKGFCCKFLEKFVGKTSDELMQTVIDTIKEQIKQLQA